MLKIVHAASVAEDRAFNLTIVGSQIKASYVLMIPSVSFTLTPKCLPFSSVACLCLNLFKTSTESNPALSAMVLGIHSNAFAKAFTMSYYFP